MNEEYTKEHWLEREQKLLKRIEKYTAALSEIEPGDMHSIITEHVRSLEEMLKDTREILKSYA